MGAIFECHNDLEECLLVFVVLVIVTGGINSYVWGLCHTGNNIPQATALKDESHCVGPRGVLCALVVKERHIIPPMVWTGSLGSRGGGTTAGMQRGIPM